MLQRAGSERSGALGAIEHVSHMGTEMPLDTKGKRKRSKNYWLERPLTGFHSKAVVMAVVVLLMEQCMWLAKALTATQGGSAGRLCSNKYKTHTHLSA